MGDSSGSPLSPGEGVAAHEICTLCKGVVECVEEQRGGGGEQVADVLLQSIYALTSGRLGHKAVIINCVDILFLGHLHHIEKL